MISDRLFERAAYEHRRADDVLAGRHLDREGRPRLILRVRFMFKTKKIEANDDVDLHCNL